MADNEKFLEGQQWWSGVLEKLKRMRAGESGRIDAAEACNLIEDVLDTLVEVGNGTTDKMLHDAADLLFVFRDRYFRDSRRPDGMCSGLQKGHTCALADSPSRAQLVAALVALLNALPDSDVPGRKDESWGWCWEELSSAGQEQVKLARHLGAEALQAVRAMLLDAGPDIPQVLGHIVQPRTVYEIDPPVGPSGPAGPGDMRDG